MDALSTALSSVRMTAPFSPRRYAPPRGICSPCDRRAGTSPLMLAPGTECVVGTIWSPKDGGCRGWRELADVPVMAATS